MSLYLDSTLAIAKPMVKLVTKWKHSRLIKDSVKQTKN